MLLHDWSAVKGVTRDVYEVKDKRIFLRRMAFDLHCRNLVAVSWPEWHAAVGRFVGAVVPPREATDFLKELVESNNAIFQNANGKWGLGHLQYQEYLAAVELAENRDLSVLDKVGNSWWSEILEMYAEITQDVGHVIRHFRNSDRLRFVLKDLMRMLKRAPHTNPSERKLLEDAQAIEASFETDPDLELSPLEQV